MVTLLAGIDLLTGTVHALVKDRHRSREFIEFLKLLDAAYPPVWPGATPPVPRNRRTRLVTALTPTPNWAATLCRDNPPSKKAATAHSRRSIE
jgi:hypothetical protein